MNTEIGICVILALCVVAPAVLVLVVLRQLYAKRFRRNTQRHLNSQQIVECTPSVFSIGSHDNFYTSNIALDKTILIDPKLSPEIKVQAYIASIPTQLYVDTVWDPNTCIIHAHPYSSITTGENPIKTNHIAGAP